MPPENVNLQGIGSEFHQKIVAGKLISDYHKRSKIEVQTL